MPQTFYSEEEYMDMYRLVEVINNIFLNIRRKIDKVDSIEPKKDSGNRYTFIPYHTEGLIDIFIALRKHLPKVKNLTFLDAGAGCGNVLLIAKVIFDYTWRMNFEGIEIDDENVPYQEILGTKSLIKKGDIMKTDYSKYDIIYFYCPFSDAKKEREFEELVLTNSKVGAYIISTGHNTKFYKCVNSGYLKSIEGEFFQKIKPITHKELKKIF